MEEITFSEYYNNGPSLLSRGEGRTIIGTTVVAVVNHQAHDWAVYHSEAGRDIEWIARWGDKVWREAAEALFPTIRDMGFRYRG